MINDPTRLYLQDALETLFPSYPVYYRPPGDMFLARPCIVYTALQLEPSYANNLPYSIGKRFQVTFLSDSPGIDNLEGMFSIPNVVVTNHNSFTKEDVAHDVFTVTLNTI